MPGIPTSEFGLASRALPQGTLDGQEREQRLTRYGGVVAEILSSKVYGYADEGVYFTANNNGTGVATTAAPTSFSDTAPMFTIYNTDSTSNQLAKNIYLDWLRLTQTAAGTAGVDIRFRFVLDSTVPSAGTVYTPVNPNTVYPKSSSIAVPRLLPTGVTQSGNSRVPIGTIFGITTQTAPLTAGDEVYFNFGGSDTFFPIYSAAASTNVIRMAFNAPPIVLAPGWCFMLEFLITSQSAASSWTVELGWWER